MAAKAVGAAGASGASAAGDDGGGGGNGAMALTVEEALQLRAPTERFMCPITANSFGIEFLSFFIRDMESGKVVFSRERDPNAGPTQYPADFDFDQLRSINYHLPARLLRLRTIGTKLVFRVGAAAVKNFRMIERHYFRGQLIKSYDFTFPFCIPNSTNEWEAIYDVPRLEEAVVRDMIAHPFLTESDSFYFVEGRLIMHNKARYRYSDDA
jgi:hypothetical protein